MARIMLANSLVVLNKAKGFITGLTVHVIQANGYLMKCQERVHLSGQMAVFTKVNF